jgi:paraquat-inducible protein A
VSGAPVLTARAAGLVGCTSCGRVNRAGVVACGRCGAALWSREPASLQRVWAWMAAGIIAYVPANIYPMLRTTTLGQTHESTIVGGVVELMDYGNHGVAAIVFVASVVIPVMKFVAIAWLAVAVHRRLPMKGHGRMRLFEFVEWIGRWSMIDVFVVALLSALVQLDFAVTINPGIAAVAFALSVAFTMLSAQAFDPRLIWDAESAASPSSSPEDRR